VRDTRAIEACPNDSPAGLHDGDFNHFAVDIPRQRLILASEQNLTVEVIDLRTIN
jgi:hypothetical protein